MDLQLYNDILQAILHYGHVDSDTGLRADFVGPLRPWRYQLPEAISPFNRRPRMRCLNTRVPPASQARTQSDTVLIAVPSTPIGFLLNVTVASHCAGPVKRELGFLWP